jgi:hypothetical protein
MGVMASTYEFGRWDTSQPEMPVFSKFRLREITPQKSRFLRNSFF